MEYKYDAKVASLLNEKIAVLGERLKPLLAQHPDVRSFLLCIYPFEPGIVLYLWYPHREKHGDRPVDDVSGEARLQRLTIAEANLLGLIASEMAGDDFDVEYVEALRGRLEYSFIPKDVPK